ncbi:MAG: hypothetical protein KAF64_06360 [Hydrogenophaga sp.]|uniref:contractile injection system protein, VgrG/Pvc8 family n=1 Tax=Hydrogenophaga sp. TaxID=1904254 RepID=UPI0025C1F566|nr:contractile injection system protein, VgrG/Pvc8 family [Hydrogenophaga sp.]MBU7572959.1 hypothetical protein [Hydrogenophaga sp.]
MTPFTPRRGLTIRSAALPEVNGAPLLEPLKLEGEEGINQLFDYRLVLQSAEGGAPLELDTFIGRELTCCIELEGQGRFVPGMPAGAGANQGAGVREISALITEARYIGESGRHALVEFTLRPWLHLATLSTDCKVFQDQSVVEIIEAVLGAYTIWNASGITSGTTGTHTVQAASFGYRPGKSMPVQPLPETTPFNELPELYDKKGQPVAGFPYELVLGNGRTLRGVTDAQGGTQRVGSGEAAATLRMNHDSKL